MSPDNRATVQVEGRELSLSNLDKVLYPATGFTKGDLIAYYLEIAPVMLPHLQGRPLTLKRFPDGVTGKSFFEKHLPSHAPAWMTTARVPTSVRAAESRTIEYAVVSELAGLIWAANLATIEFHVPMWKAAGDNLSPTPDLMVFDLDPGPTMNIADCGEVALLLVDALTDEGLHAQPKTSGKKGMQLYVPLAGGQPWREVLEHAHQIAQRVKHQRPELVVTNMRRELRDRHVLIDWSQNNAAKTTIAAYSLRGEAEPTASTPISWDEVRAVTTSHQPELLHFLAPETLARSHRLGDLLSLKNKPGSRRGRSTSAPNSS